LRLGQGSQEAAASPPLPANPSFFKNACHSERSEESLMPPYKMHPKNRIKFCFIKIFHTFVVSKTNTNSVILNRFWYKSNLSLYLEIQMGKNLPAAYTAALFYRCSGFFL